MKFNDHLNAEHDAASLQRLLDSVAACSPKDLHSRFVAVIREEAHLKDSERGRLIDTLRQFVTSGAAPHLFVEKVRLLFRNIQPAGEIIDKGSGKVYWRVMSAVTFESLVVGSGAGAGVDIAGEIAKELPVSNASANADLGTFRYRSALKSIPLGRHIQWATFLEKGEPHNTIYNIAEEGLTHIQCCLGLPLCTQGHLLFEYTLPDSVPILFPTVCEAYSGNDLRSAFSPQPETAAHGRTRPHPDCPDEDCGRPECVHTVVTGIRLTRRPLEITP